MKIIYLFIFVAVVVVGFFYLFVFFFDGCDHGKILTACVTKADNSDIPILPMNTTSLFTSIPLILRGSAHARQGGFWPRRCVGAQHSYRGIILPWFSAFSLTERERERDG